MIEEKPLKLNLGCGPDIKDGFENVDLIDFPRIRKVDLNKKKLPWKNDIVSYVYTSHLIEYLDDPYNFMEEIYRICKNGAIVDIYVPHYSLGFSYAEMRHKRPGFSYFTFGTPFWN